MNPLDGNPFRTRADAQRAVCALFEPIVPAYRQGGARVSLGATATAYDLATAELEAFARPLWGIVPLVAGGGSFAHWELFLDGLARGTDPRNPQYWGAIGDTSGGFAQLQRAEPSTAWRGEAPDQRMVEMAAIGLSRSRGSTATGSATAGTATACSRPSTSTTRGRSTSTAS